MTRKRYQRDKALFSKKKIWYIHIKVREKTLVNGGIYVRKTDEEIYKDKKWIAVYVVDNSMARAIQKAVYYYGRQTGIKYLKMKEFYGRCNLEINCRRACKIEIINVRAGMGLDMKKWGCLEVI